MKNVTFGLCLATICAAGSTAQTQSTGNQVADSIYAHAFNIVRSVLLESNKSMDFVHDGWKYSLGADETVNLLSVRTEAPSGLVVFLFDDGIDGKPDRYLLNGMMRTAIEAECACQIGYDDAMLFAATLLSQ